MRARVIFAAVLGVLPSGALLAQPAAAYHIHQADIELDRSSARPGEIIRGHGDDFDELPTASDVRIHFGSLTENVVWRGRAGPNGRFTFSFRLPDDVSPGDYTIVATQIEGCPPFKETGGTPARASMRALPLAPADLPAPEADGGPPASRAPTAGDTSVPIHDSEPEQAPATDEASAGGGAGAAVAPERPDRASTHLRVPVVRANGRVSNADSVVGEAAEQTVALPERASVHIRQDRAPQPMAIALVATLIAAAALAVAAATGAAAALLMHRRRPAGGAVREEAGGLPDRPRGLQPPRAVALEPPQPADDPVEAELQAIIAEEKARRLEPVGPGS